MPHFTIHQYHVNILHSLVSDELKSVKRGDSVWADKEETIEDLTVLLALLENPEKS